MSLFGQEDQDTPELRGGFFKRLRTPRKNFVEPSSSAEPKLNRTKRAVDPRPVEPHPPLTAATRAPNSQIVFLGRALSGDDIEDVDSTEIREPEFRGGRTQRLLPRQTPSTRLFVPSCRRSSSGRRLRVCPPRWPKSSSARR